MQVQVLLTRDTDDVLIKAPSREPTENTSPKTTDILPRILWWLQTPRDSCSCSQTRGHQCFWVDSDAGACFKIKFLTPRMWACQPLRSKHLRPVGKATLGGEPWLSSRSAPILTPVMHLSHSFPLSLGVPLCLPHACHLSGESGWKCFEQHSGQCLAPGGHNPCGYMYTHYSWKAGPWVKVFKPIWTSGVKGAWGQGCWWR